MYRMAMTTDPGAEVAAALAELTGPGGDFELTEADVLGARTPVFAHRKTRLAELLADSVRHGDRDYIVTARRRVSFAEHARQVASLAAALRARGVGKGDRVAIAAANSPEWIISFWAITSIGAIAVGFNAWWSAGEIAYAVRHSQPVLIIADARRADRIDARECAVLSVEHDIPALAGQTANAALPNTDVGEDDPSVILYTSGTSGRPKGVVHSHRNLLAVVNYHLLGDRITRAVDGQDPADKRYLLCLPLFHIASLHNLAIPRLAGASTVVLHEGAFDVPSVLRLIENERVTNWGAVPTMAHRLMEHEDLHRYDLSSLRAFSLASAPSSPAFQQRLRDALPTAGQSLANSYGLTESSTAATYASAADLTTSPGTLGRPIIGVRVEIRDNDGTPVPDGVEGEIWLRSQFNMVGYWQDPEATERAFGPDRWLRTGDIGMLDQGLLYLNSRRTDLILRGGENVYPAEVEHVLAEHPEVRECMVFGVDHDDLGQEVAAVVVTETEASETGATETGATETEASETEVTEVDLTAFARERLAHFKVPTRWRLTTEALPRTATGKVARHAVTL